MADTNAQSSAVAIIKYDLIIRFSTEDIFGDSEAGAAVRAQISATEKSFEQQFVKGSPEFKNAVYLQLSSIAENANNASFRQFMGLVHQSIPDYLTAKVAQIRYAECIEDLDTTSKSSFNP